MADNHRILAFGPPQACAVENASHTLAMLHGASAAITQLRSQVRRVAPHFRTALLVGEPGTGAEAVAHALHQGSRFRHQALLCLPAPDAELAFAAHSVRWNDFAQRMLYLPEIEKMSRPAQRGLLGLMRLRGPRAVACIAFANHDLRPLVSAGVFSQEIASSLAAVRFNLPPLQERIEDLPDLIQQTLAALSTEARCATPVVSEGFFAAASAHFWPGNLDELKSTLKLAMHDCSGDLHAEDFHAALRQRSNANSEVAGQVRLVRLEQVVDEHIRAILFACHGNKLRAAEVLGISRSTLYRMLDASGNAPLKMAS